MWLDDVDGVGGRCSTCHHPTTSSASRAPNAWLETTSDWVFLDDFAVAEGGGEPARPGPRGPAHQPAAPAGRVVEGRAEFGDAIDIQDRINLVVLDRLIVSKDGPTGSGGGVDEGVPTEDEDGNPLDLPFVPGVDLLWAVDDDPSNVEFGGSPRSTSRRSSRPPRTT